MSGDCQIGGRDAAPFGILVELGKMTPRNGSGSAPKETLIAARGLWFRKLTVQPQQGCFAGSLGLVLFKNRRRRKLRARPLPGGWRAILRARMPMYARLSAPDRAELAGHIQVFIAEKYFEGCGGLRITDEMRVLIAAQACVLLLHRETDYFPGLRSVLVYPGPFQGAARATGPAGMVTESLGWHYGESWHTPGSGGPVVLSWPDVVAGAADTGDGRNVVLHEFAHQLDAESGWVEGMPGLDERAAAEWKRVMAAEFHTHVRAVWSGMPTVIGAYGAQSPAEFFAVATEAFFKRGAEMRAVNPAVYGLLAAYYRQDPAALAGRCTTGAACCGAA